MLWTYSNIFAISTPPDLVPIANHRRIEDENWTAGFGADEPQRLQAHGACLGRGIGELEIRLLDPRSTVSTTDIERILEL